MPLGLGGTLTDQEAWDVATFMDSHERPQDPRFTGSVQDTHAKFHDTPDSMYGREGERPRARHAMRPGQPERRGMQDHGCQRYTTTLDPL